jgi:ATP-dependent DNA helicase RecG
MSDNNPSWKKTSLSDPLQFIKGVGPKRAELLKKLDLNTVEDCLYFLPFRYEDRTEVKDAAHLVPGQWVTFVGQVADAGAVRIGRRRKIFEMVLKDDTGMVRAKWFQFNEAYLTDRFPVGQRVIVSGKPGARGRAGVEFIHPDMERVEDEGPGEIGNILPVYHITEGLNLKAFRAIQRNVVEKYADIAEEILPEEILRRQGFPRRAEAFRLAHLPPRDTNPRDLDRFKTPAQRRLIFEEFFILQLGIAYRRMHSESDTKGQVFKTRGPLIRDFVKLLPFELTGAQKRVLGEIMDDLEGPHPMNRLLQGDVGSGKTIVALTALLTAVENGTQAALMVPTEILAEQHYLNLLPYCRKLEVHLELLTSALTPAKKQALSESIEAGRTHIIVGTQALIQKTVRFHRLGLVVIDEQHRFGVLEREALNKKGWHPHVLIMTATPIPRSLALTLYGEMDVSLLDELPPGRQPITTRIFYENRHQAAYDLMGRELEAGRQAYVVCPLIEGSETSDLKAAEEVHEALVRKWPGRTVALVHGKLKQDARQKIMTDFKNGDIDVLVATTVIEVGIDVPNASVMVIEHAERFGLSQLHQLRGRVGRGAHTSQCLLIAYPAISSDGKARLEAISQSADGFRIAEEDLKIRGPGDFMGTRQSGMPLLRVANLLRDFKALELARKEAFRLIDSDPKLADPAHRGLRKALSGALGERMKLLDVI